MTGVLSGIEVLDLTRGIAGPVAGMLLADHGARVTKIEPPGGDPTRSLSGARVWHRGKRSAVLDLKDPAGREQLVALAQDADVVIHNDDIGIDYANPGLIVCSITGYGGYAPLAGRPAYDALVAARTGHQWESRGTVGGTIGRLSGTEGMMPGLEAPEGCWVGADRPGPVFSGVPWPSMGAAYLATLGISATLRARGLTGRGQRVDTSLLQAVLLTTMGPWIRVDEPDTPNFQTWVIDPRAPRGFFKAADGRWTHHWVPLPAFVLQADDTAPRDAPTRIATNPEEMVLLHHYTPLMAEAVAKLPADAWVDRAAQVGVPVQPVRSPEEALLDPLLLADGCVVELDDPELGPIRQVGKTYELSACPAPITGAIPDFPSRTLPGAGFVTESRELKHPLEGITVLDLGLAVAGPFGAQLLADLGADVIKVNNPQFDAFWMLNHIGMLCNRGKRAISINLKDPKGMAILHQLVEGADVVHHNMRYDAAERLGVDYESLKQINPRLVYCHTRGHERSFREPLPGNDQTGAALAGVTWLEGGLDHGGNPIWPVTSLGDTGNGLLSAIAVIQALYHRDRTGEGQFVSTAIVNAHLLNASMAWTSPDGSHHSDRPSLDADQLGWHPHYRLYRTAEDGWICIAAVEPQHKDALARAVGPDAELERAFAGKPAAEWQRILDDAGVPAEVSSPDFVLDFFADPAVHERGLLVSYRQRLVGQMTHAGHLVELSDTPGRIELPPLVPGQDTRAILGELGYQADEIDKLLVDGTVEAAD